MSDRYKRLINLLMSSQAELLLLLLAATASSWAKLLLRCRSRPSDVHVCISGWDTKNYINGERASERLRGEMRRRRRGSERELVSQRGNR